MLLFYTEMKSLSQCHGDSENSITVTATIVHHKKNVQLTFWKCSKEFSWKMHLQILVLFYQNIAKTSKTPHW